MSDDPRAERLAASMDWSMFDGEPENTIRCNCEAVYRSHSRINMDRRRSITRKPCPNCGRHDNSWMCSSDPEVMTIGGAG